MTVAFEKPCTSKSESTKLLRGSRFKKSLAQEIYSCFPKHELLETLGICIQPLDVSKGCCEAITCWIFAWMYSLSPMLSWKFKAKCGCVEPDLSMKTIHERRHGHHRRVNCLQGTVVMQWFNSQFLCSLKHKCIWQWHNSRFKMEVFLFFLILPWSLFYFELNTVYASSPWISYSSLEACCF